MTVATKPLTGNALLNKLKEIPNLSKSEKAKVELLLTAGASIGWGSTNVIRLTRA
jgi:hypothetical protein